MRQNRWYSADRGLRPNSVTATAAIAPGTLLNQRYRIERAIALGGFGRTYLARDEVDWPQRCLLKEFQLDANDSHRVEPARQFFEREATILRRLSHPQIPRLLAAFESEGRLFLVQDYIEGTNCWTLLVARQAQNQAFREPEILWWLRSLLGVLDYIHACGIIHRDISPDNIMLPVGDPRPRLIDFGVATILPGDRPTSAMVGKLGYAPPEQLERGQYYANSDLYALAATALVLLTGELPSQLYNSQQRQWQWRDRVKVSEALAQTLERMLAAKPSQRWQSASEVLAALPPGPAQPPQIAVAVQSSPSPLVSEQKPPPRYDYRAVAIATIGCCWLAAALFVASTRLEILCRPLNWCEPAPEIPLSYADLQQQAARAYFLSQRTREISQLERASVALKSAIAQLQALPVASERYLLAQQTAIAYRQVLHALERRLRQEKDAIAQLELLEDRAAQLSRREQTASARESLRQLHAEWERLLDRLDRIPKMPVVADRLQQRRKEYQDRRDRLEVKIERLSRASPDS